MKIELTDALQNMGKNRSSLAEKTLVRNSSEVQEPPLYKVLLHNDDYTTMDFVVMILC